METVELIDRCRMGDEQAAEEFVACYSPAVYRLACSILKDPAEASEAAQDALVSAIANLKNFSGKSTLATWVYAIALNECRARLRRNRVREKLNQILGGIWRVDARSRTGPEDEILRSEEGRLVWDAVQSLDDLHRIPVLLRYYQQLSIHEIAEILGLNEGTVHSRLNTARTRLHALLNEHPTRSERSVGQEV